jgi:hypothetical protein
MLSFSSKGSTRDKTLSGEILKLRLRATDLDREIGEGEAVVTVKQAELARLYIPSSPDTAAIERTTAVLTSTEVTVKGKLSALAEIEARIAAKERELADFRDAEMRKKTVEVLQVRERRFDAAGKGLLVALVEYAAAAGDIAPVVPEAEQLHIFAQSLAVNEIPVAADLVTTLLGNHIRAIQSRTAPAALPQAEAQAPKPVAIVQPETVQVFTMKGLRWVDEANRGMTRKHPQFAALELSPALAERAIADNLALAITDPRVAEIKRSRAPKHLPPDECTWIGVAPADAEPATTPKG